jgi:hypothetical protein
VEEVKNEGGIVKNLWTIFNSKYLKRLEKIIWNDTFSTKIKNSNIKTFALKISFPQNKLRIKFTTKNSQAKPFSNERRQRRLEAFHKFHVK